MLSYNNIMVRVTAQDAQDMKDAYAKMYAPKEEPAPETEASAEEPAVEDEQETYPIRDYNP